MVSYFPIVTGSLTVLGNISVSGSITTSGSITISGSITSASFASTASYWSGSITNALSASFATSASNATNAISASYANNLTVAGTLTAQTIVVQTITSSVDYITGSSINGSLSTNTHLFTGSVSISGSSTALNVNSGAFFISSSGKIGIGTTNPTATLQISGSSDTLGKIVKLSNSLNSASIDISHVGNGGSIGYANLGVSDAANTFFVTTGASTIGTGITMNNAGYVGINNSIPGTFAASSGYGTLVIGDGTGGQGMTIYSGTAGTSGLMFARASTGTGSYAGYVLYTHSTNTMELATGTTPRISIASTGTVTFSGDTSLQGNNYINTGKMIQFEGGSYWSFRVISSAATFQLYQGSTGNTPINVDSAGRMVLTSPSSYVLTATNSTNTSGQGVFVTSMGSNNNNASSYHYIATTGGADKFYVYGNGTYTTVSDVRLKKNISTVTDTYLDKVKDLRIVKYHWNDQEDGSPLEFGMIAQEVEEIIPSIVHEGREHEDNIKYKGIQASVLPYILIKALQELNTKFEEYKATHP